MTVIFCEQGFGGFQDSTQEQHYTISLPPVAVMQITTAPITVGKEGGDPQSGLNIIILHEGQKPLNQCEKIYKLINQ